MRGWILDLYPDYYRNEIVVWVKRENGRVAKLTDRFVPSFYVGGEEDELNRLLEELSFSSSPSRIVCGCEKELIDGTRLKNLLKIEFKDYLEMTRLAENILQRGELSRYHLYNVDISLALRYLVEKKISPMLHTRIERASVLKYTAMEDPADLLYNPPELREAEIEIRVERRGKIAKPSDPIQGISLHSSGNDSRIFNGEETEVLESLVTELRQLDPDVVYTRGETTDSVSYLLHRAEAGGFEDGLHLGRDRRRQLRKREGRTYFSYGRVVFKPPFYALSGRILLDRGSFLYRESGVHGLIDLSRFSGIPLQALSQMSPGNAITTMQLRHAYEKGILVPWKRQNPEYFKTAWMLLHSDRGGYIFDSRVGIYEDVAELDFASMYPNIMVRYNISPETVLCRCCRDSEHRVPVLDYNICEKRIGLVPEVLKPVIERRFAYKRLMRTSQGDAAELYGERQSILKWLLITSFGYQGYRNARFGRIEGHEAICAYGRELLLKAKEVAEYFDFEVIHGLVDSLWVKREARVSDLEDLCELISGEIGIDINLEGRYRWIVFLPNKSTEVGAPNRYYGLLEDGSLKVRGIEMRMHNIPGIIWAYQKDVLEVFSRSQNIMEFHDSLGETFNILRRYIENLRNKGVNPEDLIFSVFVTKSLGDYRVNNFVNAALKHLRREGVELFPGQVVRYIVTDQRSRRYFEKVSIAEDFEEEDSYDSEFYRSRLIKATESLLLPFGYTAECIEQILCGQKQSILTDFI